MTPDETALQVGTYTLLVIARGGRLALRVRDRESAARAAFKGIDYFPDQLEPVASRRGSCLLTHLARPR